MSASENNNLANQRPVNPNHVKAEETIAEAVDQSAANTAIFRDMLSNVDLPMGPSQTSGTWGMLEVEIDGKKVPHAVLVLAQNNTATAYFFSLQNLEVFMQGGSTAFQALRGFVMSKSPLIVAGAEQLEQAVQAKSAMDKHFGSQKEPVNWPPKNGNFGV